MRSIARYADIEKRSGMSFHTGAGLVYASADPRADLALAQTLDVDAREVTATEVAELFGIAMASAQTIIFESAPAGHVNPRRMIEAQNRLVSAADGVVMDAAVTAATPTRDGVQLTVGNDTVVAGNVLLCTGAWAAELVGVDLPLERTLRTILLAELDDGPPLPSLIRRTDADSRPRRLLGSAGSIPGRSDHVEDRRLRPFRRVCHKPCRRRGMVPQRREHDRG